MPSISRASHTLRILHSTGCTAAVCVKWEGAWSPADGLIWDRRTPRCSDSRYVFYRTLYGSASLIGRLWSSTVHGTSEELCHRDGVPSRARIRWVYTKCVWSVWENIEN